MSTETDANNQVWFVYSGLDRNEISRNATHFRVASSVTEIPAKAFEDFENLLEVILQEGLVVIGAWAFCYTSITEIEIPSTVVEIRKHAFHSCFHYGNSSFMFLIMETVQKDSAKKEILLVFVTN